MKIITLLNEKGGVGKTTLSSHIAAGLAIKGHRVVLVDADPQGNATSAVGLDKQPHFYDLIVRHAAWKDVLRQVHPDVYSPPNQQAQGQLYIVSGNNETRNVANSIRSNQIIRHRFLELTNAVRYMVVDSAPAPSLVNEGLVIASDYILFPTDLEVFSALEGLPATVEHVRTAHEAGLRQGETIAQPLGIIPNKYRSKTTVHRTMLKRMVQQYGDLVWKPIPLRTGFADMQLEQRFLFALLPDADITAQIWQLVGRVEQVGLSVDVEE